MRLNLVANGVEQQQQHLQHYTNINHHRFKKPVKLVNFAFRLKYLGITSLEKRSCQITKPLPCGASKRFYVFHQNNISIICNKVTQRTADDVN
jgi:hypothetical protein